MDETSIPEWIKIIGGTGVGALMYALVTKIALAKMGQAGTERDRAGAESDIIEQLRKEVERMGVVNDSLAEKVNALQLQVVDLRGRNADLQSEVNALTTQIKRMRAQPDFCDDCPKLEAVPA